MTAIEQALTRAQLSFYRKTGSPHCGYPRFETNMRLSNLQQTLEETAPEFASFMDSVPISPGPDDRISQEAAVLLARLHALIGPHDEFTQDEIGLLMNAGGFDLRESRLTAL